MALFVYVTGNCEQEARTHSLWPEVERFRDRVEATQSTSLFDQFPKPYFVKKKLGGRQGRLIASLHTIGDHAVLAFLSVLIRGEHAYDAGFGKNPQEYGAKHFANLVDEADLARFIGERTRTSPPVPKRAPRDVEYQLLYGAFSHHGPAGSEDIVCETARWVEQVSQERMARQLVLFCGPCLTLLSKEPGLHFQPVETKPGWGVWGYKSAGRLLLIAAAGDGNADDTEKYARELAASLEGKTPEQVLRVSRRAYPAIILADDDLWIDLENESQANMALSPEESEVLESARKSDRPFPLFINGRAGSGKSTILQYLFADLLFFFLRLPEPRQLHPPLYLTANSELLRVARSFVERLLKSEATFVQQNETGAPADLRGLLDNAFRQFQPHLLSLVAERADASRFALSRRVDYTRFRNLWTARFGKEPRALRDFGPDISWHVIRSYVKGMSSETYLDPDDYRQLPENQITVTTEAFRLVYERVWSWYGETLKEQQLWDDQDLAAYVLEHELAEPLHPAILCDEAQDFTRIELELLLRLSLFSDRSLAPNDLSRVPFVFAGDQFQTLNPTGFRWDSIKASFVEKFIFELDPARRSGRTDLNYRELQHNYRSTHRIVRFGNEVQALRAALFQLPDLRPQLPWTEDPNSFPVTWFRSSDAQFWTRFAQERSSFVLIVPCNEGEEAQFVSEDPVLKEYIPIVDGVPQYVLSASRAKGCEYPAVIVYGFGEQAPANLMQLIASGDEASVADVDESLPIQYFINRLYVAVSRPKQRLVIVDSDEGLKKLWSFVQDQTRETELLRRVKRGAEVWADAVEGMTAGSADDLSREVAANPAETAAIFEQQGLVRRDGYYFSQAAQAYRSAGNHPKARECRARALEADGMFLDAGKAFWVAGFVPDAVNCLWRAGKEGWQYLAQEAPNDAAAQRELQVRWAKAIFGGCTVREVAAILEEFARRLGDEAFADSAVGDGTWKLALEALMQPVAKGSLGSVADDLKFQMLRAADEIRSKHIAIPQEQFASLYAAAGRFSDAIALWEEIGATRSPEYAHAKASVEPYPQRLALLARSKRWGDILNDFSASPGILLTVEQTAIVVDAMRESQRYQDAIEIAWKAQLAPAMADIALHAFGHGAREVAESAIRVSIPLYVGEGRWEIIANVASQLRFAPKSDWNKKGIQSWIAEQSEALRVVLVRALARPSDVGNSPLQLRKQIQDFLRNYLRVKKAKWHSAISLIEAGAALERADRFTDAIVFYEAVDASGSFTKEQRAFAQRRWLVSKGRQLKYEGDPETVAKARDIQREITQRLAALRIQALSDLPEFPELPALGLAELLTGNDDLQEIGGRPVIVEESGSSAGVPYPAGAETNARLSDTVAMVLGPFKLELSRSHGRCNITHMGSMETGFIKITKEVCGGECNFVRTDDGEWVASDWQLSVRFGEKPGTPVNIYLKALGIAIQIGDPATPEAAG